VTYAPNFSATFSGSDTGGELIVTSGGTNFAVITLVGDYVNATFDVISAPNDTVAVIDPQSMMPAGAVSTLAATGNAASPGTSTGSVALLGSYMAALFASPEGQVGTPAAAETGQSETVITHPHAT